MEAVFVERYDAITIEVAIAIREELHSRDMLANQAAHGFAVIVNAAAFDVAARMTEASFTSQLESLRIYQCRASLQKLQKGIDEQLHSLSIELATLERAKDEILSRDAASASAFQKKVKLINHQRASMQNTIVHFQSAFLQSRSGAN